MCANNTRLFSAGIGDLKCNLNDKQAMVIKDVTYVPNLSTNLLNVSTMVKRSLILTFTKQGCQIYSVEDFAIRGEKSYSERGRRNLRTR